MCIVYVSDGMEYYIYIYLLYKNNQNCKANIDCSTADGIHLWNTCSHNRCIPLAAGAKHWSRITSSAFVLGRGDELIKSTLLLIGVFENLQHKRYPQQSQHPLCTLQINSIWLCFRLHFLLLWIIKYTLQCSCNPLLKNRPNVLQPKWER